MRRAIAVVIIGSVISLVPPIATAANHVTIESTTIIGNGRATVGVYLENDVTILGLSVPLVFRSVTGGAYPDAISTRWNGRLFVNVAGVDPLSTLRVFRQFGNEGDWCTSGVHGFNGMIKDGEDSLEFTLVDLGSPDCILYVRHSVLPPTPLAPGSDFPIGVGEPSIVIDIEVPNVPGFFAIDTTCAAPSSHLQYTTEIPPNVAPGFTPSMITVADCVCPHQGDFNADGVLDATDLNGLIRALFFNGPDPQDPSCPTTRGDFDFSGVTDSVDLNDLIGHLYFNQAEPTDPCAP